MKRLDQHGEINLLLVPLILSVVLFLAAGGFAAWAYTGRQDYKDNVESKVADAVTVAKDAQKVADGITYAEKEKRPLISYSGPEAYGSIVVRYPKTWSGYVDTKSGSQPLDAYFHPNVVPADVNGTTAYALRVQIVQQSYAAVVKQYDSFVKSGKVTVQPYKFVSVSDVAGVRVDGSLTTTKTGSMIIVPLRDKTLKIWTESKDFVPDFDNNILPNFTFVP